MKRPRLKRIRAGIWQTADGKWEFRRIRQIREWFAYDLSGEDEADPEWPALGERFETLREAVAVAVAVAAYP